MNQQKETKFKVFVPGLNGKAGLQPLTHDKGRWAGRIRTFATREDAEGAGKARHPKALAIPIEA